ncbi:MAG: TolC family protein [Candidatus Sericytochromatia bacterium]|nr:TolC family protein [Candidatus Sericytochromatia bacterium]
MSRRGPWALAIQPWMVAAVLGSVNSAAWAAPTTRDFDKAESSPTQPRAVSDDAWPDVARVLREAAMRQPDVVAAQAEARGAEARRIGADKALLPTLGVSAGASVLRGQIFGAFAGGAAGVQPGGLGGLPLSQDQVWPNVGVTLNQPIFDGGKAWALGDAARHQQEAAVLRAERGRRHAVYSAWRTWLDLLDQEAGQLALDARRASARERVARSRLERTVGSGSELAVLQAEADLQRQEDERRHEADALILLRQEISRRYGGELLSGRPGSLRVRWPEGLLEPSEGGLLDSQAARADREAAEAVARSRGGARWPQAAAFVTATAAGRDLGLTTVLGGASVTWQPVDLGRQDAAEAEARAVAEQARAREADVALETLRELQQASLRRKQAAARTGHARLALQLAWRAREEAEARRNSGASDTLESLVREEAVVTAQVAVERAERDQIRADLALAEAVGLPPEELLVSAVKPEKTP